MIVQQKTVEKEKEGIVIDTLVYTAATFVRADKFIEEPQKLITTNAIVLNLKKQFGIFACVTCGYQIKNYDSDKYCSSKCQVNK